MTNAVIADTPATNKIPNLVSDQSKPVLDFEALGSVADRVVSQLVAKMQPSVD